MSRRVIDYWAVIHIESESYALSQPQECAQPTN